MMMQRAHPDYKIPITDHPATLGEIADGLRRVRVG